MKNMLPKLVVDQDKCVLCHECEENCPVEGIVIDADPPFLQEPCIYCWRCVMVCPEIAIDAKGSEWGVLHRALPESYAQFRIRLDEAADRGEYRWLIDPDAVDYTDHQLDQRRRKQKEIGEAKE